MQNPYVIYGTIKRNGSLQTGVTVTVRNDSKSQEYAVLTNSGGKYWMDLGDVSKFPSGYSENDVILVTSVTVTISSSVTGSTNVPPTPGKEVSIHLQEATDLAVSSDGILRDKNNLEKTDVVGAFDGASMFDPNLFDPDIFDITPGGILRGKNNLETVDIVGASDLSGVPERVLLAVDTVLAADSQLIQKVLLLVSDALALGPEEILAYETLQIVLDVLGLSDAVLLHKPTALVEDTSSLAEQVDIITSVLKQVTDALGLADLTETPTRILLLKDVLMLAELSLVNKSAIPVVDLIGLLEQVALVTAVQMSESEYEVYAFPREYEIETFPTSFEVMIER